MNDLGLSREIVELVPHNPKWRELFEAERVLLLGHFEGAILEVSHGGSTAIPGIPAKPILDLFAIVFSLEMAEAIRPGLEGLGYEWRGPHGIAERRYCVKGPPSNRTHHLHLVEADSEQWRNHLLFRDYCIWHPDVAQDYGELKQALALRFPNDRKAYTDGKEAFIRQTIAKAVEDR